MIKVAAISDIHGNLDALNKIIEEINKQGIKKILILGDMALMGPEPNDTVSFLQKIANKYEIEAIQGNTDLFIVNKELPNVPEFAKNAIIYAQKNITAENIEFLFNNGPDYYNVASALSLLLMVMILVCLAIMNKFSDDGEGVVI